VLLFESSFDNAIEKAEIEAANYVEGSNLTPLEHFSAYEIFDETIGNNSEVFSMIRDSDLEPETYISTFFDTGEERNGILNT